jgi:hypothetical protein
MDPPDFDRLLASCESERFVELRTAQEVVLNAYAADHLDTPDLAIELPTGAGKSLIALLIGEAWRSAGKTVAVLTGNKVLATQMEREGLDLGVQVARMEGRGDEIPLPLRRKYRRANAIGVMNYWVMFNSNPVVDSADLLIIDDVHLAEGALENRFSVHIDRYAHPRLFSTLAEELVVRLPEYASLEDATGDAESPRAGVELISYLDQCLVEPRAREIIDGAEEMATDRDLRFRWQAVRERFAESNVYVSGRSITIRPYCLPVQTIGRWQDPTQRIYLSATIGDPGDLQRRLGSNPIVKITAGEDVETPTLGRRMIVVNNDIGGWDDNLLIPAKPAAAILAALREHPKALWLCASGPQADNWEATILPWLAEHKLPNGPAWRVGREGDEIEQFRDAEEGHLFAAGRFDGMDFADSDCRLVVLATLPRAVNDQEQFVSDYLRDAGFMVRRINQRITQALGRCNRQEDDYAVYVLADRRLAGHLSLEANRRDLPMGMQAELDLAEELEGLESEEISQRVTEFLSGDFSRYDEELEELAGDVPTLEASSEVESEKEVDGWLALTGRQDYLEAEKCFKDQHERLADLGLGELAAFTQYCEAKAAHLEGLRGDGAAAQRARGALEDAIARGGSSSSWFNRLRSSVQRAAQKDPDGIVGPDEYRAVAARVFDQLLEEYPPGERLDSWKKALADDLESQSHDVYVGGLKRLGELLGHSAILPTYGSATDCRWHGVFGNHREAFTFEAKIEHRDNKAITSRAVGQAHNQKNRAIAELEPKGFTVRGLIVTHLERLSADAAPGLGELVVLRRDAVDQLHARVNELLTRMSVTWSLDSPEARLAASDELAKAMPPTGWLTSAIDNADRFLDADGLMADWPDP